MGVKELKSKRLSEKLRQIREFFDLSQNELIKEIGFSNYIFQGNISQYELGRREPPLPVLLQYARLAEISVESLIDDNLEIDLSNNQKSPY